MKNIVLTILLLIATGCKAQINNNLNKENMKYFNVNNFKDWEKDTSKLFSSETSIYLKRGNERMKILIGDDTTKQITISDVTTPYVHIYRYNAKTNILFQESRRFYDVFIGTTKTYDETGKIIKTRDWDAPYKISIEELIFISKNKLGIDLMDMSLNLMLTRINHTQPVYVIGAPLHPEIREIGMRYITISGNTGQILFDKEIYSDKEYNENSQEIYQMKESTPFKKESKFYLEDDEYQKHLKDKKK